MKKITCVVISLATMIAPLCSFAAEEGFHLIAGVNSLTYSGLKPSGFERRIQQTPGVESNYTTENSSASPDIGVGYCINQYFCADLSYTRGVKLRTTTHISSIKSTGPITINWGTIDLTGLPSSIISAINSYGYDGGSYTVPSTTINPVNYATNINLTREGEASAIRASISGEYPLGGLTSWLNRVAVIGRVGFYSWRASVVGKVSVDNSGIYLAYNEHDKGTDPFASAGAVLNLIPKKIDLDLEYFHIKNLTMVSMNVRYKL